MKRIRHFVLMLPVMIFFSSTTEETLDYPGQRKHKEQIRSLTRQIDQAELKGNVPAILKNYTDSAISMPEFQVIRKGRQEIGEYLTEMFKRRLIKMVNRRPHEFIHLKNTVVEFGTFKEEYLESGNDMIVSLNGKYCHVWAIGPDGALRIKGETFGFFHPIQHPESFVLSTSQQQNDESEIGYAAPFELRAYNALMEKGVRERNANLRASFFADDAAFYPFADTVVSGMKAIKPYLIAYSSRGIVTLDSVSCYTYSHEDLGDYVLEYAMFKVKWTRAGNKGRTEGKGIRVWKRMADHSLRLYREMGTHNYL